MRAQIKFNRKEQQINANKYEKNLYFLMYTNIDFNENKINIIPITSAI